MRCSHGMFMQYSHGNSTRLSQARTASAPWELPDMHACLLFGRHACMHARLLLLLHASFPGRLTIVQADLLRPCSSELRPSSSKSIQRAEAEAAWLRLYHTHGVPVHVFRLGGDSVSPTPFRLHASAGQFHTAGHSACSSSCCSILLDLCHLTVLPACSQQFKLAIKEPTSSCGWHNREAAVHVLLILPGQSWFCAQICWR